MLKKLYTVVVKVKNFAELGSLMADSIKYFHDEGVARGVFKDTKKDADA